MVAFKDQFPEEKDDTPKSTQMSLGEAAALLSQCPAVIIDIAHDTVATLELVEDVSNDIFATLSYIDGAREVSVIVIPISLNKIVIVMESRWLVFRLHDGDGEGNPLLMCVPLILLTPRPTLSFGQLADMQDTEAAEAAGEEYVAGELYNTYCEAVGGVAFNGDKLPEWCDFAADDAKKLQSNAWRAAAARAIEILE